jgi:hypothetical protein
MGISTNIDEQEVATQMQRVSDVDEHRTGDATPCRRLLRPGAPFGILLVSTQEGVAAFVGSDVIWICLVPFYKVGFHEMGPDGPLSKAHSA